MELRSKSLKILKTYKLPVKDKDGLNENDSLRDAVRQSTFEHTISSLTEDDCGDSKNEVELMASSKCSKKQHRLEKMAIIAKRPIQNSESDEQVVSLQNSSEHRQKSASSLKIKKNKKKTKDKEKHGSPSVVENNDKMNKQFDIISEVSVESTEDSNDIFKDANADLKPPIAANKSENYKNSYDLQESTSCQSSNASECEDERANNAAKLDLDHISSAEIVSTFDRFKYKLAKLFKQYQREPDVKKFKTIKFQLVQHLLGTDKQLEMLKRIKCEYEPDNIGNTTPYIQFYINVLMPEWLLGIFILTHKMTRADALQQLSLQEDYFWQLRASCTNEETRMFPFNEFFN